MARNICFGLRGRARSPASSCPALDAMLQAAGQQQDSKASASRCGSRGYVACWQYDGYCKLHSHKHAAWHCLCTGSTAGSVYCLPAGADMRHVVCRKTISFAAGLQPLAVAQHDEQDSIFRSRCVKQQAGNCQSLIVLCAETALPTTNCQLVHILLSSGCAATSGLCT